MKARKSKSRDLRFFLLGMLDMFLIVLAVYWQDAKRGFMDGISGRPYNYKEAANIR